MSAVLTGFGHTGARHELTPDVAHGWPLFADLSGLRRFIDQHGLLRGFEHAERARYEAFIDAGPEMARLLKQATDLMPLDSDVRVRWLSEACAVIVAAMGGWPAEPEALPVGEAQDSDFGAWMEASR